MMKQNTMNSRMLGVALLPFDNARWHAAVFLAAATRCSRFGAAPPSAAAEQARMRAGWIGNRQAVAIHMIDVLCSNSSSLLPFFLLTPIATVAG